MSLGNNKYLGMKITSMLETNKLITLNINPLLIEMQRYLAVTGNFLVWEDTGGKDENPAKVYINISIVNYSFAVKYLTSNSIGNLKIYMGWKVPEN